MEAKRRGPGHRNFRVRNIDTYDFIRFKLNVVSSLLQSMSRLKLPVNNIERSDGKVILANGRLHSIVTGKHPLFLFPTQGNLYRAQPRLLYICICRRIETMEDANPSYFRINFDSIKRRARQPEAKGLPGKGRARWPARGCIKLQ